MTYTQINKVNDDNQWKIILILGGVPFARKKKSYLLYINGYKLKLVPYGLCHITIMTKKQAMQEALKVGLYIIVVPNSNEGARS